MMAAMMPTTPIPPFSPRQLAVERAIGDLRRGGLVAIRDSTRSITSLVLAAELADSTGLAYLAHLAESHPNLAITRNRAEALKPEAGPAAVQSIALPGDLSELLVRGLADPSLGADFVLPDGGLSIVPEPENGSAAIAIALAKMAHLLPAVVISRVFHIAGDRIGEWCRGNSLLLVETADILAYPSTAARRLIPGQPTKLPLADAENTQVVAFRPADGGPEHLAIMIGEVETDQPALVRLHSQCLTGDLLASLRCDCGDQLRGAIRAMNENGSGVVLYLSQEGRDIGLSNKLRAYGLQDLGLDTVDANRQLGFESDERAYEPAAEMLRHLGISKVRLLTNNPDKMHQLEAAGVTVSERVSHSFPANPHNSKYLDTKAQRSGHLL
jgi:GTP cyclohydrolase II